MDKKKNCPPMTIRGSTIKPTKMHKFLGVLVDEALCWHKHVNYAIGKGTAYMTQLRRLSNSTTGLPLKMMCQLYTVVTLPKMLYAIDIWCLPMYIGNDDTHQRGSIQVTKRLNSIQRIALLSITGALKLIASDTLEAHAKLMPLPQCIQNLCHRAALCIAATPPIHPLHPKFKCASKCFVLHHRSSLHHLARTFRLTPDNIEMIHPACKPPEEVTPINIRIPTSKEKSI